MKWVCWTTDTVAVLVCCNAYSLAYNWIGDSDASSLATAIQGLGNLTMLG